MIYTVILNDRSYDLPKKTISVTELLDSVAKVDSQDIPVRDKYRRILDCIKSLVGEGHTEDIFGTNDMNEMDLSEITLAFRKIIDAYNKPMQDYIGNSGRAAFEALPIKEMTQLANATAQIERVSSKK